jgi:hypothetical protein
VNHQKVGGTQGVVSLSALPTRLDVTKYIEEKIPRHWRTLLEDIQKELKEVTNTMYEGSVSKGLKQGHGQMVYPNGDVYKGVYRNGERSGAGICRFGCNGAIYKGEWRDDKIMGNGILFSPPNEIIEARFDGYRITDGQFKILFTNGEYYEGQFRNNMRNGTGQHNYKNGDFYEGDWANDRRIGRGRLYMKNGSKLSGMFIDDKADGYVEFEDSKGNMFQTENEEAKASSVNLVSKKSKSKLSLKERENATFVPGSFTNGKLYHRGVINFKNGDKFRGVFKDGRPCGFGIMKYIYSLLGSNGSDFEEATYQGEWKAGKRQGKGSIVWADGSSFSGEWLNDMRHFGEMRF